MSLTKLEVLGEGSLDARIALIGEAPGIEEKKLGRPFMGLAGDHLTKIMHLVGLARTECYITNVLKEHPPANDLSPFFMIQKNSGKVITSPAYNAYVDHLATELSKCKANVFVPMGNAALYALTGLTAITKRRGSILEGRFWKGMKVIPTIHPSAALRQYMYTHYIRMDLKRAVGESLSPAIVLPVRILKVKPSYVEVVAYLQSIKVEGIKKIGYDIEVINEEIGCLSVAKSPWDCMSIPFTTHGIDYFTPDQEAKVLRLLADVLEDPDIVKVGQNITFDYTFGYRKFGIRIRNLEDTMVQMGVLFPDFPKGLDFITAMYTKEPYYKDEGKKWFKLGGSEYDFWIYNAKDSAVCLEAQEKLEQELIAQDNMVTYQRQKSIIPSLVYMAERGIKVNVKGLSNASEDAGKKIDDYTAQLHHLAGFELNPQSPKQLAEYLYKGKGLQPYVKTVKKDGRTYQTVTTDEDALKRLSRKGIKEAGIILQIRKYAKLKGTYFDIKLGKDGRLRSAYNPVGTKTGRLSSSEDIFGEGGNMQNIPPAMLEFLIADTGCLFYVVDLEQAENRIVANIAPEPLMKEAFESGRDLHCQTGGLILGKPWDQVSRKPGSSPLGSGEHSERDWGKKANHSLNYDLGFKNFSLRFEMPETQGKWIVERYHQVYPGVRQYHSWVRDELSRRGRTLINCMGRKRLFLDRWGDDLFKEAYAWIPQSTVADKINEQGIRELDEHQEWYWFVELLNQVHDSLVLQIPISVGWVKHAEALIRLKESLEKPVSLPSRNVPDFVIPLGTKCGLNLKDTKGVKIHDSATETAKVLEDTYLDKVLKVYWR